MHTEIEKKWLDKYNLAITAFEGSTFLGKTEAKPLFTRIYKEFLINDTSSGIAIEGLLLQVFSLMQRKQAITNPTPYWVNKEKELIHDLNPEHISLERLLTELEISSSYLSHLFPKYFGVNFGEYIRKVKVDKATALLSNKNLALGQIAYDCGFADQSHFIRCFREFYGMTPSQYRKLIIPRH